MPGPYRARCKGEALPRPPRAHHLRAPTRPSAHCPTALPPTNSPAPASTSP
jgi:hypothetical protein